MRYQKTALAEANEVDPIRLKPRHHQKHQNLPINSLLRYCDRKPNQTEPGSMLCSYLNFPENESQFALILRIKSNLIQIGTFDKYRNIEIDRMNINNFYN